MIPRLGFYAVFTAAALIVLLGVRQWLRQRKADRQWAAAVVARQRAAENRRDEIDALERMYAAGSTEEKP